MQTITDPEFGEILVRRSARARSVRIHIGTDGRYIAGAPNYTPLFFIKRVISSSRPELRRLAQHPSATTAYTHGQQIGKSHNLAVVPSNMVSQPTVNLKRQSIIVMLPSGHSLADQQVQQSIKTVVAKALRVEAKAHLPKRLAYLAAQHGFTYQKVRFSHSGGRWGSCSSSGTISLNIALMKLPHELIDYVIVHELCHTRHMNHSASFWNEVKAYDPLYKLHKQQIKQQTPSV